MDILIFYGLAIAGVAWSFSQDRQKTRQALKKSWIAFENILPAFMFILLLLGASMAVISPESIHALLGENSGAVGMFVAAAIGSITLIPGFIAFPMAKTVLEMGAGIMQVAVFVSTLMMVGVITAPMESQFFNRKIMLIRNGLSFAVSFVIAIVIGRVVG